MKTNNKTVKSQKWNINYLLLLMLLITTSLVNAQQKAVTEIGDEVILYEDGTWKYLDKEDEEETEIPVSSKKFGKDYESTFLLKSNKINIGFWLNPEKWSFRKTSNYDESEYELELKGEELFGMIITEKSEIPLEKMRMIALENARDIAFDCEIVKEEYRTVNGLKVLFLQMEGTFDGIKFSYYGYYFSNANGTVQFLTFTTSNLLDDYLEDCEKLLNGLVLIE